MQKMILFIVFLMILTLNIVYADQNCSTTNYSDYVPNKLACSNICNSDEYYDCSATWDLIEGMYECTYKGESCAKRPNDIYVIQRTGTGTNTTEVHILNRADNFQNFMLQTGTALHDTGTGGNWTFAMGSRFFDDEFPEQHYFDHPHDIYAIKSANTGTKTTEVHIIDGVHDFDNIRRSYDTALPETGTGGDWVFKTGRFNSDSHNDLFQLDIFAIKRTGTGSGTTEVHILSGGSSYKDFLLRTGTALPDTGTGGDWAFSVGDYNDDDHDDIFAIKRAGTGSGKTEVHILDGASNFQNFLVRTGTALHETGSGNDWAFGTGDYNDDGSYDVYAIKRAPGTGKTEVHILDGANTFQSFLLHTKTALNETGSHPAYEFCIAP